MSIRRNTFQQEEDDIWNYIISVEDKTENPISKGIGDKSVCKRCTFTTA